MLSSGEYCLKADKVKQPNWHLAKNGHHKLMVKSQPGLNMQVQAPSVTLRVKKFNIHYNFSVLICN